MHRRGLGLGWVLLLCSPGATLAQSSEAGVPVPSPAPASATAPSAATPPLPGAPVATVPATTPPASAPASPSPAGQLPAAAPTDEAEALHATEGQLRYLLDGIEIRGNQKTRRASIRAFVGLRKGESFAVEDSEFEAMRYRLLGTGWFDRVELRLARGHAPGWATLVIEVEERQTLVFQELAAGVGWSVEGLGKSRGGDEPPGRKPEPYLGLAVAETNFLGTGKTVGVETLLSPDQQGLALRFLDPIVRASRWALSSEVMFANGQEYFGGDDDVLASVACSEADSPQCESRPKAAVVDYWRFGLSLGTARDVGSFSRLSVGWHGDFVAVPPGKMPVAASEIRGRGDSPQRRAPIDFAIEPYNSYVSMLTLGLTYDKRDGNALPSRGANVWFRGDLASGLIGSDYEFVRLQSAGNRWFPLGSGHTIRLGAFAGSVFGRAPFFYKFFVSDLTDLQPSRILGLNLDHRPAPNLFGVLQCGRAFDPSCGTAIAQMRQQELAARIDAEYAWPFARGRRGFLKGGDVFALIGLFSLLDAADLKLAVPGYEGIARVPIDLTVDVGVRLDTAAGIFRLGLAKLAWLPVQ